MANIFQVIEVPTYKVMRSNRDINMGDGWVVSKRSEASKLKLFMNFWLKFLPDTIEGTKLLFL